MISSNPLIMGILNVTPDSFFRQDSLEETMVRAKRLIDEGAAILDIGGESTRPGATPVELQEEIRRVLPVIEELRKIHSTPLSIDTRKPEVARLALEKGASLINDVTGLSHPEMRVIAKSFDAEICVMHMQGTPETMQIEPHYPEGIVPYLSDWFERRIELLLKEGIKPEKIILDPGIGFGKTVDENLEILIHFKKWKRFGLRVLIGISRKSFMGKLLQKSPSDLLPATLAMNTMALFAGADIIRVHDVAGHKDIITLLSRIRELSFERK